MKMKAIVLIVCLMSGMFFGANAQSLTAKEIIKKADDKNRGESSKGEMTMSVVRPKWDRTVTMKVWTKGTEKSLILITAPQADKGQVFLKLNTEMWNWIPSIQRMMKIPPSMMMQSWMGSDFTNDDLVKESSIIKDYNHKLIGSETVRSKDCYKIELIPKDEAPVVWGKLIVWVTKDGFDQWKVEFYDEDDDLVSTQNSYDIKKMGDREIPTRIEIIPEDEPGHKTILVIKSMEYDIPIDDGFFSQQNMKRVR
jgi:outer membrane lipoprotein-sorting protein